MAKKNGGGRKKDPNYAMASSYVTDEIRKAKKLRNSNIRKQESRAKAIKKRGGAKTASEKKAIVRSEDNQSIGRLRTRASKKRVEAKKEAKKTVAKANIRTQAKKAAAKKKKK